MTTFRVEGRTGGGQGHEELEVLFYDEDGNVLPTDGLMRYIVPVKDEKGSRTVSVYSYRFNDMKNMMEKVDILALINSSSSGSRSLL